MCIRDRYLLVPSTVLITYFSYLKFGRDVIGAQFSYSFTRFQNIYLCVAIQLFNDTFRLRVYRVHIYIYILTEIIHLGKPQYCHRCTLPLCAAYGVSAPLQVGFVYWGR